MPRSVRPHSAAHSRPLGAGARVHHVSELRAGDNVEIRAWDMVRYRGEVDAVCPQLGVLWVLDGPLRNRVMIQACEYTVWKTSR